MQKDSHTQRKHFPKDKKNLKIQPQTSLEQNEARFAGVCKQDFVDWLRNFPTDQRYLVLKVRDPKLTRSLLDVCSKTGDNWKVQVDLKKISNKSVKNWINCLQNFLDALVLISDKEYLDSIGFDFSFVGNPQKLYQNLSNLTFLANKNKSLTKNLQNDELSKIICPEKEQWLLQVLRSIETDYIEKMKTEWDPLTLQREKSQKKQFGNFWKNLNKQTKNEYLLASHSNIKDLVMQLIDQGVKADHSKLEQEIKQLMDLDKKDICNKVFKSKLKKYTETTYYYYQILYETWRQFSEKKKAQDKQAKSQWKKKKPKNLMKRDKSLDACSNETNETEARQIYQISNQQLFKHFENDITECCDYISEASNKYFEKRVLAFERIQAVFRLYGVSCKLFGSCASGITIKDSDVDIAINENILKYFQIHTDKKKQMGQAFQFMGSIFESLSWVSSIKVIKTAAIPIIKLTINTEVPVVEQFFTKQYADILNRKIQYGGEVHADLTIETTTDEQSNHLGIVSTTQINKWLQEMPTLRPIIILLKYQLAKRSLNQTYLGGLNTYCLVVMAVSFIVCNKLEKQTNVAVVLNRMLYFYGWDFDEAKYGIDLRNKNQVFFLKSPQESCKFAQLQVRDPLNDGKIMTKNCYQFIKIKQIIREIYKYCFTRKEKLIKEQTPKLEQKLSKRKTKQQSESQSSPEKQKLKNYFLQFIF